MSKIEKYGLKWPANAEPLQIEMAMIKKGGRFKVGELEYGNGLVFHYEQMRQMIWPELDSHRWHNLIISEVRRPNAKVTVLLGPGSSSKTHEGACNYLMEYYCHPEETCVLVSSTDIRGLELRVWGEIKSLHERAKMRFDFIPGNLIDSKHAIATDEIDEDQARDLRRGIIAIPTVTGGKNVGLGKWVGIKQKRIRLVADESQLMGASFLSAFANLDKNEDFQALVLGNPIDFNDPLGRAAEPKEGWLGHLEPKKTECWDTRFMNGRCVNLIGTDSPNFDFPADQPTRYKYLISREKIANTLSFFPENSLEYYSQCIGAMKVAGMERRVLNRDLIRQYLADQDCHFEGETTKVYFVDASYGGDLCVAGMGEFGKIVDGKIALRFGEPKVIPIVVGSGMDAEYQIANFVKQDCQTLSIVPQNMGHDATGRGSLGTALAVVWSNQTVPVESGGSATNRPVCNDLFVYDDKTNPPTKRLKLGHEHYDKRVTEFWFSLRYAVESAQIRNLPDNATEDLVERKWDYVRGNRISVEPKSGRVAADGTRKVGMKERIGRSPDYGDWACGILEMARRRGFTIEKLGKEDTKKLSNVLQKLAKQTDELLSSRQLQNA